ncbi:MAG: gamma-glutamyl-gamma-aminobutyrate hydrolase family protein [Clostridiales bacterium]|nr:gamma-glutamyl-gamma-aminobutyrate hydrolase family protein [Clostridiales bacterium]
MYPTATIAIVGRSPDTVNYENALHSLGANTVTSLEPAQYKDCDALLLPGGGDITPAFFGQLNRGSKSIDTNLDIEQFRALEMFINEKKSILGICKGLQIINVHFGGTIHQHLRTAERHRYNDGDQFHYVYHIGDDNTDFFYQLYENSAYVNSAHHQGIDRLGKGLIPVCQSKDGVVEGIIHEKLPIMAVQWHPERLLAGGGCELLYYFLSICSK